MRFLRLLISLCAPVWAAPIITAPINVSGSGFFDSAPLGLYGGYDLKFAFTGTNGTDTVSISAEAGGENGPASLPTPFVGNSSSWDCTASIDGVTGACTPVLLNHAGFTFQNGGGSVTIQDMNGSLLAEAPVIGYIDITSEEKTYGPLPPFGATYGLVEVTDTFDILPTPEPSAVVSLAAAFSAIALSRLRSGSKRRIG